MGTFVNERRAWLLPGSCGGVLKCPQRNALEIIVFDLVFQTRLVLVLVPAMNMEWLFDKPAKADRQPCCRRLY